LGTTPIRYFNAEKGAGFKTGARLHYRDCYCCTAILARFED